MSPSRPSFTTRTASERRSAGHARSLFGERPRTESNEPTMLPLRRLRPHLEGRGRARSSLDPARDEGTHALGTREVHQLPGQRAPVLQIRLDTFDPAQSEQHSGEAPSALSHQGATVEHEAAGDLLVLLIPLAFKAPLLA